MFPLHVFPFVATDDNAFPLPLVYFTLLPYSPHLPSLYLAMAGSYPVIPFTSSTVILVADYAPFPCPNIPHIAFNSATPFIYPALPFK